MRLNFVIIFILLSLSAFSQNTLSVDYKNVPLKTVISDIETKTGLLFSYKETLITQKSITINASQISIELLLKRLEKQSGLIFQRVSKQQIIIKLRAKITICGYVFESNTKTSLPNADIYIEGSTKGATTNDDGFFQLENIAVSDVVVIQYLGFKTVKYNAQSLIDNNCQNIYLTETSEALNDVIINAYITSGFDKNNDGSTNISNDELGILPGQSEPDIFQSLASIPGINSLNESASDIQIRGGSKDQNLIIMDDIKLYNTGHFFGMLSAINPYIVENTKIYKSGASAQYGDRVSGIIDISTATEIPDSTKAGFGINGTHIDGFIKAPLSHNISILASVRRSYVDVFSTPTFEAFSEKVFENSSLFIDESGEIQEQDNDNTETISDNLFYFFDTNIKLLFKPTSKDNISLSGLLTSNDLDFSSASEDDIILDKLNIDNRGVSLVWNHNFNSKISHNAKVYFSTFESIYENSFTSEGIIEERNNRSNKVEDFGISFDIDYHFSKKHKAKIGYQYSNNDVFFNLFRQEFDDDVSEDERDFNTTNQNSNNTNTLFGEYIFTPKENSFISFGIRTSRYSVIEDFYIEPRLNIEYPLSPLFRLKATAEKRFQAISELVQFEDTDVRLENSVWSLSGIDDIPLLSSNQFSGGFIFDYKSFVIDVDVYNKKIKGLTSFTNGFSNATEEFSEGESTIFGVDVLVKKTFNDLNFWLGYTFNDVDYTFEELSQKPFRGNNDITHNFRISSNYKLKQWQFSLGWNYRTGSPFTPVESFNVADESINFGEINSKRLPDYHRLDASLLYNFKLSRNSKTKGVLGLSFQNIYARQIPLSVFYRIDNNQVTDADEINRIEQLSLGFTPNVTLRINF